MILSIVLAITFPVVSVLLFKEFDKRNIDTLTAIVFNYLGAIILGMFLFVSPIELVQIHSQEWFWSSVLVGGLFLLNFFLIAKTAINQGVSIATFANKISLVFPVVFTVLYFGEPAGILKLAGVLLALYSIYLLTVKSSSLPKTPFGLFPLFIFLFTGIAESAINYTQKVYFSQDSEISYFVIACFSVSFVLGSGFLFFQKKMIKRKEVAAGLLLSIPNTFGLYFFIKSLKNVTDTSALLPIINIGTLLMAILVGVFLYQEKLSKRNWWGILIAIFSILILTIS